MSVNNNTMTFRSCACREYTRFDVLIVQPFNVNFRHWGDEKFESNGIALFEYSVFQICSFRFFLFVDFPSNEFNIWFQAIRVSIVFFVFFLNIYDDTANYLFISFIKRKIKIIFELMLLNI